VNERQIADKLGRLISENYEIGELKKVKRLDRGYVNTSYEIETERDRQENRYFLRQYKKGIREEEVKFEHSIINHLVKKKFELVARIVGTKDQRTYVRQFEDDDEEDKRECVFYAVFGFLPGEDRYSWDNPFCCDDELESAATVLAQYHDAVFNFNPEGRRHHPRIIDLLPQMVGLIDNCARRAAKTRFDLYFLASLNSILSAIDRTKISITKREYQKIVHLPIHGDYHPGNLKFQDQKVTGLFDFDWSRIDARCFDVALAVTYFCSAWEGRDSGNLLLDKTTLFLSRYQKNLPGLEGLGPLEDTELELLPPMMSASNLFVLCWDLVDFYSKKVNAHEYFVYLQHNVQLMKWLEDRMNLGKLEKVIVESTGDSSLRSDIE
jgi:homoserine kinase type II